jgi:hypothetical protein
MISAIVGSIAANLKTRTDYFLNVFQPRDAHAGNGETLETDPCF